MGKPKAKRVTARQKVETAAEKQPVTKRDHKLEFESARSVAQTVYIPSPKLKP